MFTCVLVVFLYCISYVTNLASWLQHFNKFTYLSLATPVDLKENLKTLKVTIQVELIQSHAHRNSKNTKKGTGGWTEDSEREKAVR